MKRFQLTLLAISGLLISVFSQSGDEVLFTVNDTPVKLSEFEYIYQKNNGENADFSKESIEEYLDLYIKFKLKVAKARQLRLDTITALQEELAGYRKQLASSYLVDKELSDKLVEEVYTRKQKDIRLSHILFRCDENASEEEQERIRNKATILKAKIESGADFRLLAKTLSEDKASGATGGNLGWMTAMLPDGFYDFENAMYNLAVGEVSDPVKSNIGFHIIKVTDIREARGEMEVSHILIRTRGQDRDAAAPKLKIDSIYNLLNAGDKFDPLARQYSEDKNTAAKGGYLGFFGIGQFDIIFEQTAFELEKDGDISEPVQTALGWHIIKRLSKKDYSQADQMKREIQPLVAKNDRFDIAKLAMIEQIKKSANYRLNRMLFESFTNSLETDFYSYRWETPEVSNDPLFNFGSQVHTLREFADYCKKNSRTRLRFDKNQDVGVSAETMLRTFIHEKAFAYEESHLEEKYPDFKELMREYSEGILLFEATKINVWDRASTDTAGLNRFYSNHKEDYYWDERAVLSTFRIHTGDIDLINDVFRAIRTETTDNILEKFNKDEMVIEVESTRSERGSQATKDMEWKAGSISKPAFDLKNNLTQIKKIENILPAGQKSMAEARGYIIADYQDELEKAWVEQLRIEFPVSVNSGVLNSMIKS